MLPGRRVQVESWFDLTGDSPRGALVKVLRADGSTLTQGKLNSQGVFAFTYSEPEALKVVVDAVGHRKELDIPARELAQSDTPATTAKSPGTAASAPAGSADPKPFADRTPRVSLKDVLIGVGFLLAVAAFVLSLRNARQLREMKGADRKETESRQPAGEGS